VSFFRGIDGTDGNIEPVGRMRGTEEIREAARSTVMATGTLACPSCDAPVAPAGPLSPADRISCPYCRLTGAVRQFLSLAAPSRPARVQVRVVAPRRLSARR
jgi:hypothetical protein